MKNNRQTLILLCLLGFMLLYGFYSYLLKPKLEANEELEKQIETAETALLNRYSQAVGYNANVEKLNERKRSIALLANLFYSATDKQEDFIDLLHEYFNTEDLRLVSINSSDFGIFTGTDYPGTASPYMAYVGEGENEFPMSKLTDSSAESDKYPRMDRMELSVIYNGPYENIQSFFEKFNETDKFTTCSNLTVNFSEVLQEEEEGKETDIRDNIRNQEEEEEEEEEKVFESRLSAVISFPRLANVPTLSFEAEELEEGEVVIPPELLDGSYRDMFSFDNLMSFVKGIFGGE